MIKPKMYINTCDATMFFLPLFNYFYGKYWTDQDTIILGYREPDFKLLPTQQYISMSPVQVGGVHSWSTYLRNYFSSIDDDIILWGIDDHLVVDTVNYELIDYFHKKMVEDPTIGRVGLTYGISNRQHRVIDTITTAQGESQIIELTQCEYDNGPFAFRIDCNFGLWRKSYLLRYLYPDWTPWQFEVEGSKLARNDGWKILSAKGKFGVLKVEGKRSIAPNKVNMLGVKFEDILETLRLGLVTKEEMVGVPDWL